MALLALLTQKGLFWGILGVYHDRLRFKTTLFGQVWIRFSEGRFDPQKVLRESPFEAILTLKWAGVAVLGAKTGHFGPFGSFWVLLAGGDPARGKTAVFGVILGHLRPFGQNGQKGHFGLFWGATVQTWPNTPIVALSGHVTYTLYLVPPPGGSISTLTYTSDSNGTTDGFIALTAQC
jgi:hypothetical protein